MFVAPGIYDLEVVKATEKTSKANNEMIVLECVVKLPDGRTGPEVSEFLVFTDKASWKIDLVRAACGEAVVPGEKKDVRPEHFEGAGAVVEIGTKPGDKDPDKVFNTIEAWLLPADAARVTKGPFKDQPQAVSSAPKAATTDDDNLDDIPF